MQAAEEPEPEQEPESVPEPEPVESDVSVEVSLPGPPPAQQPQQTTATFLDVLVTMHPSCSTSHEVRLEQAPPAAEAEAEPLLVEHLMAALAVQTDIPVWRQRLFHGGEMLEPGTPLAALPLAPADGEAGGTLTVELVPRRPRQRQADPARLQQWAAGARARVAADSAAGHRVLSARSG